MKAHERVRETVMVALILLHLGGAAGIAADESPQAKFDVAVSHPLLLRGQPQKAYIRVGLTGFEMAAEHERPALNVAIVIDKSGSMTGQKLEKAKEAAIVAIGKLNSNDIVSVIAYDTTVSVIVPATKVSDKQNIYQMIRSIEAGSNTALFAGVSKGAAEVRKFIGLERVNRIVLLSDGLANVGSQSPSELGNLGASLIKEGISVTTIGLGLSYNEDLMTQLAYKSDGSHYFAEEATELAGIFDKEFSRTLSVVAQDVRIEIKCSADAGVRPVRFLGRQGRIVGKTASLNISNLYSKGEKFALLEVEIPAAGSTASREIASVTAVYTNMKTHATNRQTGLVNIAFCDSKEAVENATNSRVMVDIVQLIATERNELAVALRDKGQVTEAKEALTANNLYLMENAARYDSLDLKQWGEKQIIFRDQIDSDEDYAKSRKWMRKDQFSNNTQQSE